MAPARISYVFIDVVDVELVSSFYENRLGFECYFRNDESVFLRLASDGPALALLRSETGGHGDGWRLVIDVEDIEEQHAELSSRLSGVGPIEAVPYGRAIELRDPEGNRIELHQPDDPRM